MRLRAGFIALVHLDFPQIYDDLTMASSPAVEDVKQQNGAINSTDNDSDDDKPLSFRLKSPNKAPANKTAVKKSDSDDEDNCPIAKRPQVSKATPSSTAKTGEPSTSKAGTSAKPPAKTLKRPGKSPEDSETVTKKLKIEPKTKAEQNTKKRPIEQKEVAKPVSKKLRSTGEDESTDTKKTKQVEKTVVKKATVSSTPAGKKKVVETKVTKKTVVTQDGKKWTTLVHNGVIFPPPYQPHGIKMLYDGKPVNLTSAQEEVATMYAVMKDTEYMSKPKFNTNFWNDWKKILGANHIIKKLELCDFTPIYDWYQAEKEKKKQLSTAEKKQMREEKAKAEEKYTWALVDGVKEKVGNFRVEPPGLFRGRGEHPKMGKLKRRIFPEDIVINIGKDAPVPECPMPGHKWKEIRHDNTVTWLAFWNDPINERECKYVFLHPSSSLKAQSDMKKYEKARLLKDYIENIRKTYTKDFTSSDETRRQIAVATYLIDRLALRAGNEKDDDEADTVGCCSLKVEHVKLLPSKKLEFDFLGKDSIRYYNEVAVEEKVYKAIGDFKKGKKKGDDLFDRLDTSKLNAHLKELMPELTAKVFRTYNASITLDSQLVSTSGSIVVEKVSDYQRANKEVAILCNHQRTVSKGHGAQMEKLETKMAELKALREEIVKDLERAKQGKPPLKDADGKPKRNQSPEQLQKKLEKMDEKIQKTELDMKQKDDLKTVALGTSKINYLDPRITVAWCKRNEVPIEKVFQKSLLQKFAWAMDVEPTYRF